MTLVDFTIFMLYFSPTGIVSSKILLSVIDPTTAGLKEGKKCRERKPFLPYPRIQIVTKEFLRQRIQLVKPRISKNNTSVACTFALVVSPSFSRPHDAVIRVYDAGLPNARSARAMQNGVRLALLHFLQQLTDFRCGRRNTASAVDVADGA
jgi:hypothetical protein